MNLRIGLGYPGGPKIDKLAKEGLLDALKKYNGTVIFVSHESDFVNRLATKIYNIEDLLLN